MKGNFAVACASSIDVFYSRQLTKRYAPMAQTSNVRDGSLKGVLLSHVVARNEPLEEPARLLGFLPSNSTACSARTMCTWYILYIGYASLCHWQFPTTFYFSHFSSNHKFPAVPVWCQTLLWGTRFRTASSYTPLSVLFRKQVL